MLGLSEGTHGVDTAAQPPHSPASRLLTSSWVTDPSASDSCANLAALGAKLWASLDEIIDQIIIERDQGITTPGSGFEQNPFGARGFEDLAALSPFAQRKVLNAEYNLSQSERRQ